MADYYETFVESLPEAAEDRTVDILFVTDILDEYFSTVANATGTATITGAAQLALSRLRGEA